MKKDFEIWIDKYLKEKNIDITEEFEVEHNKKKYIFSIGKVGFYKINRCKRAKSYKKYDRNNR